MNETKEIIVGVVCGDGKVLIIKRAAHNRFDPDRWEFVSVFIKKQTLVAQAPEPYWEAEEK